jgi:hypothetical protein
MDGIHLSIGAGPDLTLFSEDLLARANALFDEAERRVTSRAEIIQRVQTARLPILYVQIFRLADRVKRRPASAEQEAQQLQALFARFDHIARRAGVTHVGEHRDYEPWAAQIKNLLPADAGQRK